LGIFEDEAEKIMNGKEAIQPKRLELLHEGKAKKVYRTDNPDLYIQEFKDSATAFDGTKKGQISGKGSVNCRVSAKLFKLLENWGVVSHFVDVISDNEMVILPVKIIKVEVVVRNIAAGSLVKRLGFIEATKLEPPIIEFYLKDDSLHDPLVNDDHIFAMGIANAGELAFLRRQANNINDGLKEFFGGVGIDLVDFKLEFGRRPDNSIILADEISPDTCRLWDRATGKKLDKDRFRFDMGGVEEAYQEILERTGSAK
jgi:phosphoribosylaminoimidazole-succinocarboxamide synthase